MKAKGRLIASAHIQAHDGPVLLLVHEAPAAKPQVEPAAEFAAKHCPGGKCQTPTCDNPHESVGTVSHVEAAQAPTPQRHVQASRSDHAQLSDQTIMITSQHARAVQLKLDHNTTMSSMW